MENVIIRTLKWFQEIHPLVLTLATLLLAIITFLYLLETRSIRRIAERRFVLDTNPKVFLSKDSKDHGKNHLPFEDTEPPHPILVFGFPSDFGFELLAQKPLGRAGIISMKTGKKFLKLNGGKFAEQRCCLIDARMFGGNSGSPVMNQQRLTYPKPNLLGLVIATNSTLDFGLIEPVSRIRETLDLAKDKSMSGHWSLLSQHKNSEPTIPPTKY